MLGACFTFLDIVYYFVRKLKYSLIYITSIRRCPAILYVLTITSIKDWDPACSTGDSSLATDPPDAAPPPEAEEQCVC